MIGKFAQSSLAFLAVAFVLSLLACHSASPRGDGGPLPTVSVQVVPLKSAPSEEFYECAGTVRAQQKAVIASKVTGTILQLSVKPGDAVKRGEPLVQIESDELDAGVSQAEAGVSAAEKGLTEAEKGLESATAEAHLASLNYQRFQELFEKRSISPHEFDEVEARRQSATAAQEMAAARLQQAQAHREQAAAILEAARVRKNYARISAPFDGVVTGKQADPGTLAVAGAPLLTIENRVGYRLEASVPETRMARLKLGDSAKIAIPSLHLETTGRVVEIQPSAEVASRTFLVKISLPAASGLRSGMFGRAWFSQGTVNSLAIPVRSVLRKGQLTSVFVVSDGIVRQRLVTLGRASEDFVEVLSGLTEGDQVVTSGVGDLVDGSPAEIRR
jgi:membrane fusion protein, multidrug efflux system